MLTKIQKWGNSLALRIPKVCAIGAQLENDSVVEVLLVGGQIIIKSISAQTWTLEKLLSGVNNSNLHHEIDTSHAVRTSGFGKWSG